MRMGDEKKYKKTLETCQSQLARLSRELREKGIPVVILFEGMGTSGKGDRIQELIQPLDPRGFSVLTVKKPGKEERKYPWLRRYFMSIPPKGQIHIFNDSWYSQVVRRLAVKKPDDGFAKEKWKKINLFEQQLADDGTVILKFFLELSMDEQRHRLSFLKKNKDTAWLVSEKEKDQQRHFKRWKAGYDRMMKETDTPWAPWMVIDADQLSQAGIQVLTAVKDRLAEAVSKTNTGEELQLEKTENRLAHVDLSKTMEKDVYKKKYDEMKACMRSMQNRLYMEKIPLILVFEGWDASGKGGTIKRLTAPMDPRGYEVIPISAPAGDEKTHHYLWRFWKHMPKRGHVAVFDRSWYGRVLVERVEGFARPQEWMRAYDEINELEAMLQDEGAIILKFWLHIDKDEQERRFKERMENPEKQWKITDEDWRNREKWPDYEAAASDMFAKTSTKQIPWHVIPANSKYYARIKVMETILQSVEERLKG